MLFVAIHKPICWYLLYAFVCSKQWALAWQSGMQPGSMKLFDQERTTQCVESLLVGHVINKGH